MGQQDMEEQTMRKTFRQMMLLVMAAILLMGSALPLAQAATNLNGLALGTPSDYNARRYTALAIEGVTAPVYAYTDVTGLTQYRVYGSLGGRTGFFEADLLAPAVPGGEYTLNVRGTVPVNDRADSFAFFAAPLNRSQTVVPAGFQQGNGSGIVYFRNYFNQIEYFLYASRDQINWQYYHTDGYSRAMRGGLPVVPESVILRVKAYQTYLLPQVYRQALRLPAQYLVTTSDGQPAVVNGLTPVIPENQLPVYQVPTPAPTRWPDSGLPLGQGSYGQLVRNVQARLNALRYNAGYVDGIYGRQTAAAVSAFQQVNGLTLTGTVDRRTYDRLISSSAIPNPVTPVPTPVITPKPEPSYEGSYTVKVNTTGGLLNLWSIPNPTKRAVYSIAKIPNGTVITGVAKGNNGFSKLVYEGLEGYVDSSYLIFNWGGAPKPPAPAPTATGPTTAPTPAHTPVPAPPPIYEGNYNAQVKTTGGSLNLWSIPNPTKRAVYAIAKIPNETMLTGVAKGNNGFSKLLYPGPDGMMLEGYVDTNYLNFNVPQP